MQISEDLIRSVVSQVLSEVRRAPVVAGPRFTGRHGIFSCVDEAVAAARDAFEQLSERSLEDRKRIIEIIRQISISQCVELGTMEMHETKIGRLVHKIEKLKTLGERTPDRVVPSIVSRPVCFFGEEIRRSTESDADNRMRPTGCAESDAPSPMR